MNSFQRPHRQLFIEETFHVKMEMCFRVWERDNLTQRQEVPLRILVGR